MRFPILDELTRAGSVESIRPVFFRRLQRVVKTEIVPVLDDYDRLAQENTDLKTKVETLTKRKGAA
jgi:hypothetical protein